MQRPARSVIVAAFVALTVASIGCKQSVREAKGSAPPARAHVPVEVITLAASQRTPSVEVVAVLRPRREVTVAAEVAGRVVSLTIDMGDTVTAKQTIARLDGTKSGHSLSLVKAQRAQAEATLSRARKDLTRAEGLAKRGVLPQAKLDAARASVDQARAQLGATRARIDLAASQLRDARVRAPFAGRIVKRHVELGEYLVPGRPVATLIDATQIKITAGVPLADARRIKAGDTCRLNVALLGAGTSPGRVRVIGASADERTRRVPVEILVDNADQRFTPGMAGKIRCPTGKPQTALLVPATAVVEQFSVSYLFVVVEGHARRRRVSLGDADGANVVIDKGVRAGDRLVVVGQEGLADGTPVRVVDTPR